RVNNEPELLGADIAAAARPSVAAILLPKVEDAATVSGICVDIPIIPQIETPRGVLAVAAIAAADPRVAALAFGPEDLSLALGTASSVDAMALPAQMVVIAAAASGIPAIGLAGGLADIAAGAAYAESARRSRALGFSAGLCIHPAQVPLVNAVFGPTASEIAEAQAVRDGFDAALARGEGAARIAGRMVDRPVYLRALATLARAGHSHS
ncbi:MAG: CoA ester lyase, partial [Acetobacteraceae bacterium]|nr:CoA ester lyase [Acetobacteraceae bacterium]